MCNNKAASRGIEINVASKVGIYTVVPGTISRRESVRAEGEGGWRSDKVNNHPLIDKVARMTMDIPSVEIPSRKRSTAW